MGGLEFVFLPLADSTGLTQLTLDRKQWEKFITTIKSESVVRASGIVHERPDIDKREVCILDRVELLCHEHLGTN